MARKAEQIRREGCALLRRSEMPGIGASPRGGTLTDVEVETCRIDDEDADGGKIVGSCPFVREPGRRS